MLKSLIAVLCCQLSGQWLVTSTGLPLPGPVIGMVLLLLVLLTLGDVPTGMDKVTRPLLQHMSLLFIPAGSGVMLYGELLRREWLPITAGIIVSTLLTLISSAWIMQRSLRGRAVRSTPSDD